MRSFRSSALLFALALGTSGCGAGIASSQTPGPTPTGPDAGITFRDAGAPSSDSTAPPRGDGRAPRVDAAPKPGVDLLRNITLYVNLGDSIAAGFYATRGHSYRRLLINNDDGLHASYRGQDLTKRFPGLRTVDVAKSGATTKDVVGQASRAPANPRGNTLVTISAGGNDFNDKITTMISAPATLAVAKAATANLKRVVDRFRNKALYPGTVTILMLNVYDPTDGKGSIPAGGKLTGFCKTLQGALGVLAGGIAIKNLATLNQHLAAFAKANGVVFANMHQRFLGHGFHHRDAKLPHYDKSDPTLWFHNDCAHPNDRGHDGIRRLVWKALTGR